MTARATRHWADIAESTFTAGIWFLYGLHRLAGRRLTRLVLVPVAAIYWAFQPRARAASAGYLRRVQAAGARLGRGGPTVHGVRHFHSFAETLLDKLLAAGGHHSPERLRVSGAELLDDMIARGQGAVLVTAHVGCLELCQAVASRRPDLKLTVLVHTRHAQRFNRILRRLDPSSPVRLLQVTDFDPATAVLLDQRVRAGEFVAIAGDRVPLKSAQVARVPFLGQTAAFPVGAYVMASVLRCPLVWLACVREGHGHHIGFELLEPEVPLPRGQREAALAALAARFARRLEHTLVAHPYEWFNFFDFWSQAQAAPA